jgi:PPM family protein phosphatase
MQIYSFSEAGQGHANEDAVATRPHPLDPALALVALADGQGGQPGGGPAARLATAALLAAAAERSLTELLSPNSWIGICRTADRAVAADRDAGYCTLVALCASSEWVVGGSSGDSAAFLILEDAEVVLTERQRKNPPVGSGGAAIEPFSARLVGPWQLVVVSDGVWKYVGWERVLALGRAYRGEPLGRALRDEVLSRSGGRLPDDFSCAVLEP